MVTAGLRLARPAEQRCSIVRGLGAAAAFLSCAILLALPRSTLAAGCPPVDLLSNQQRCFTTEAGITYRTVARGARWKVYTISQVDTPEGSEPICVGENWSEDEGSRLELWALASLVGNAGETRAIWRLEVDNVRVDLTARSLGKILGARTINLGSVDFEVSEPREFAAAWIRCAVKAGAAPPDFAD